MTKTCVRCGIEKPLSEFYPKKDAPDGHESRCIPCVRQYTREWSERKKSDPAYVEKRRKATTGWARKNRAAKQKALNDALTEAARELVADGWTLLDFVISEKTQRIMRVRLKRGYLTLNLPTGYRANPTSPEELRAIVDEMKALWNK